MSKLKPQPYRDQHDHPYCSTECHCWRAQPGEMPDFCVVARMTPSDCNPTGKMCLPIINELCHAARVAKESE